MASPDFYDKKASFEFAVQSAVHSLRHPLVDYSDQPYAESYADNIENASFGVIDTQNGLIHTMSRLLAGSVVIVPLSHKDIDVLKTGIEITLTDEMLKNADATPIYNLSHIGSVQAECRTDDELLNPIVILHPDSRLRTSVQIGSTIVHEYDHAYWSRNLEKVWRHGSTDSIQGDVAMEVSAYSLEDRILRANATEKYKEACADIYEKYADFDFMSLNVTLDYISDPLTRNLQATAFIKLMLDTYNIKPGEIPSVELCNAMRVQDLVYDNDYEMVNEAPQLSVAAKSV